MRIWTSIAVNNNNIKLVITNIKKATHGSCTYSFDTQFEKHTMLKLVLIPFPWNTLLWRVLEKFAINIVLNRVQNSNYALKKRLRSYDFSERNRWNRSLTLNLMQFLILKFINVLPLRWFDYRVYFNMCISLQISTII